MQQSLTKATHGFTRAQLAKWGYSWPPPEGWKPPSQSQIQQDLFVVSELESKHNGFFVEFGACDGLLFSNTYLLEKDLDWSGILAEPAKVWHDRLAANRPCCAIDYRCVWKRSGEMLEFSEASQPEVSTIVGEVATMLESSPLLKRIESDRYEVETVSLNDLLKTHGAPRDIDYISVDTEGSEYDILSAFDFDRHNVKIFTIEHSWEQTPRRENIYQLMTSKGYKRKFENCTGWDDWYVREA